MVPFSIHFKRLNFPADQSTQNTNSTSLIPNFVVLVKSVRKLGTTICEIIAYVIILLYIGKYCQLSSIPIFWLSRVSKNVITLKFKNLCNNTISSFATMCSMYKKSNLILSYPILYKVRVLHSIEFKFKSTEFSTEIN